MLFSRIYFPLALGYAVSYFYRNINAVIERDLVQEFEIGPADLGLLTSVYFISFASFQIPLGIFLDRYGPRKTESALLLFATLGAIIFSQASSLSGLILGRLLIGFGVSACLMGAFKAYVEYFPTKRLPLINGLQMVAGGLGALLATVPLQNILSFIDWRSVFYGLSIITLFTSISIWFFLPDYKDIEENKPSFLLQFQELIYVFKSPKFLKIAPLAAISQGTILALHGLWIKPWLRDIFGMNEGTSAKFLFVMTLSFIIGFLILGIIAERLSNIFSINPTQTSIVGMMIFMILQCIMAFINLSNPLIILILLGFFGTSSILVYSGYAQIFPKALSGRIATIQNLLVFLSAFTLQWGIGVTIQFWSASGEGYDPTSYKVAIGLLVFVQFLALIWYFLPLRRDKIGTNLI